MRKRNKNKRDKKGKKKRKKLKLDFVSSTNLDGKSNSKKIKFILNKVKDGSILVFDGVMNPEEEMDLIRETMRRVDDGFPGIEVCSLKKESKGMKKVFEKLSSGGNKIKGFFWTGLTGNPIKSNLKTGMTLIGPARVIKRIKKNPDSFSVMTEV